MKLLLIKFKHFFLLLVFAFLISSCAILGYEEDKSNTKIIQTDINKNKCPTAKIPAKTARYVSTKIYILSIKKIEMICKSNIIREGNVKDFVIQYKAEIELRTNPKVRAKDLIFPNIYIAIVDMEKESVLAKMVSGVEVSNKIDNLIVNKNKIRFKYGNSENLSIYFGLQ